MDTSHITPINNSQVFFESFKKTSAIEKVAHWSKIFCYAFLALTILAIIVNLIFPFAGNETDLFTQLLFLLIFWGTIELLTFPLEYIYAECVVDFEKNWIAERKMWFFFRQFNVLASFNQIKAIGVSQKRPSLFDKLLKNDGYAIFVQTLNNKLYQISDFSLDLDRANNFCHRLYSTHFSGAAHVGGMPGIEINIDKESGAIIARQIQNSLIESIQILLKPFFQASLAFVLTVSFLALAISLIARGSHEFFEADLKVHHQPVFKVLLPAFHLNFDHFSPTETEKATLPTQENQPAKIVHTFQFPYQDEKTATSQFSINIANKKIITGSASTTSITTATPNVKVLASVTMKIQENYGSKTVQIKELKSDTEKKAESRPYQDETEKLTHPSEVVDTKPMPDLNPVVEQDKEPKVTTRETRRLANFESYSAKPVNTPLIAKVPDIDGNILEYSDIKPSPDNEQPGQFAISLIDSSKTKDHIIEPGKGLATIAQIGDSAISISNKIGPPTAHHRTGNLNQLVFPGFTLIADSNAKQNIKSIIITGEPQKVIPSSTIDGIKIGSKLEEVKNKLGPYSLKKDEPGLHFEEMGISFIPSPTAPENVGMIQVYEPQKMKN
jgi:hypothetical protein